VSLSHTIAPTALPTAPRQFGGFWSRVPWRLRWLVYLASAPPHVSVPLAWAAFRGREVNPSALLHAYGANMLREALASASAAGMRPFLSFGTLLGHHRDGGFIRHDADIDLGLLEADHSPARIDRLEAGMHARGFLTRHREDHEISFYKYHFPTLLVDFFLFFRESDAMVYYDRRGEEYYRYSFPPAAFASLTPASFVGVDTLVPADIEAFLHASYGDWRTPRTAFDNVGGHPNRAVVPRPARFDGVVTAALGHTPQVER
jgi:hypothetical protein